MALTRPKTAISRWRGILARVETLPCPLCQHPNPAILRPARGWLTALYVSGGAFTVGGTYAATARLALVGWPLILVGVAHYVVTWWLASPPRAADLPGNPGDSIRS